MGAEWKGDEESVTHVCWKEGRRNKAMGVKEVLRLGSSGRVLFLSTGLNTPHQHL